MHANGCHLRVLIGTARTRVRARTRGGKRLTGQVAHACIYSGIATYVKLKIARSCA